MLSLPLPAPIQPDLLRTHNLLRPRSDSPPPRNSSGNEHHHRHPHANNSTAAQKKQLLPSTHLTPHALLLADESTLAHRKLQIRNFGATWIRPPGIGKTLQAMCEEEEEMREMEEMARQEQGLADLRARTAVEEARAQAEMTAEGAGEGEGEVERDLDDEIPDADAVVPDAEDGGDEGGLEDVTFNEESIFAEGSAVLQDEDAAMMEEAELTGAAQDEQDLGVEHERDLDDSVPDAGSYQHTDTEVEDSSSSSEDDEGAPSDTHNTFDAQSARRRTRRRELQQQWQQRQREDGSPVAMGGALQGGLQERMRAQTGAGNASDAETLTRSPGSLNLSSSLLESSFVGSSPVVLRGRGGAGRRRRGRLS